MASRKKDGGTGSAATAPETLTQRLERAVNARWAAFSNEIGFASVSALLRALGKIIPKEHRQKVDILGMEEVTRVVNAELPKLLDQGGVRIRAFMWRAEAARLELEVLRGSKTESEVFDESEPARRRERDLREMQLTAELQHCELQTQSCSFFPHIMRICAALMKDLDAILDPSDEVKQAASRLEASDPLATIGAIQRLQKSKGKKFAAAVIFELKRRHPDGEE